MNIILSVGVLVFTGFLFGEIANKLKLPKISGYIFAGLLLNPSVTGFISSDFTEHTDPLLTVALSLIVFSIGGALTLEKMREKGKKVLILTAFESVFAFLAVFVVLAGCLFLFFPQYDTSSVIIAVSLLLASLAAPTDPSATLAVIHEYKAKGEVSDTMLEIAAFDDIAGIIIYTLATAIAAVLLGSTDVSATQTTLSLMLHVGGAIGVGVVIGFLFNWILETFQNREEGTLIVVTFGMILVTYGLAEMLGLESLLATIAMGTTIANVSSLAKDIFKLIERYTDELIFVVFFTLSGLHLDFSAISGSYTLIFIYIIARAVGKFSGIYTGAVILKESDRIRKYAAGGLIPQGGIVIGLALLLAKNELYQEHANTIVGVVIGAALLHEIVGPLMSRMALKNANEIA